MNKKVMKLASRGKRLGGYAIDAVLPMIISMILIGIMVAMASVSYNSYYGYGYGYGYEYNNQGGQVASVLGIMVCILMMIAYLGVQIFFFTKSQTIGKAILGMRVVDSTTGEPIGVWRMILREWFAKKASASAFLLGYIWVAVDDKNRGWHDKIVDSYVVDIHESDKLADNAPPAPVKTDPVSVQPEAAHTLENTAEITEVSELSDVSESTETSEAVEVAEVPGSSEPAEIQCETEIVPE